jgi:hypothetical protein
VVDSLAPRDVHQIGRLVFRPRHMPGGISSDAWIFDSAPVRASGTDGSNGPLSSRT